MDKYPLTAVVMNPKGDKVYIGGIDNQIKEYCLKQQQITNTMYGHTDTITSVSLSEDGSYLLSNSID